MRKAAAAAPLVALWIALTFATVHADPCCPIADFYRDRIEKRLDRCERKLRLLKSKGENLQHEGEEALAQINFYRDAKQDLVSEMVHLDLGTRDCKADYFLIKAFCDSTRTLLSDTR